MPVSIRTELSLADDAESSAYVTPLATPSELPQNWAHEDDILGEDDERRSLHLHDDDGTRTPTNVPQSRRERSGSQATERQTIIEDHRPSVQNGKDMPKQGFGSEETRNKVETQSSKNSTEAGSERTEKERSLGLDQGELTSEEKVGNSCMQSSVNEIENDEKSTRGNLKEQNDRIVAPSDPVGATEHIAKSDGSESTLAEEEKEEEQDDETKYPGGFSLAILTVGLALATFVIALDNTIIGKCLTSPMLPT